MKKLDESASIEEYDKELTQIIHQFLDQNENDCYLIEDLLRKEEDNKWEQLDDRLKISHAARDLNDRLVNDIIFVKRGSTDLSDGEITLEKSDKVGKNGICEKTKNKEKQNLSNLPNVKNHEEKKKMKKKKKNKGKAIAVWQDEENFGTNEKFNEIQKLKDFSKYDIGYVNFFTLLVRNVIFSTAGLYHYHSCLQVLRGGRTDEINEKYNGENPFRLSIREFERADVIALEVRKILGELCDWPKEISKDLERAYKRMLGVERRDSRKIEILCFFVKWVRHVDYDDYDSHIEKMGKYASLGFICLEAKYKKPAELFDYEYEYGPRMFQVVNENVLLPCYNYYCDTKFNLKSLINLCIFHYEWAIDYQLETPCNFYAMNGIAMLFFKLSMFKQASALFERILKLEKFPIFRIENAETAKKRANNFETITYYYLGMCCYQLGKLDESLDCLSKWYKDAIQYFLDRQEFPESELSSVLVYSDTCIIRGKKKLGLEIRKNVKEYILTQKKRKDPYLDKILKRLNRLERYSWSQHLRVLEDELKNRTSGENMGVGDMIDQILDNHLISKTKARFNIKNDNEVKPFLVNYFSLKHLKKLFKIYSGCCNFCGENLKKLSKCGRCKYVFYCSKNCQVSDWKRHKKECNSLREMKNLKKKLSQ